MRGSPDYELQQVTQNLNMLFDRRGDVAYWDDFESPTQKGNYFALAGGSAARSNEHAKFNDYSLKCVTSAFVNDDTGVTYQFTDYAQERIGSSFSFMTADSGWFIMLVINNWLPAERHDAILRIIDDGTVEVWDGTAAAYVQISPDAPYANIIRNWATLKLVIDLETNRYVRALIFGREYDLSMYSMRGGMGGATRHISEWLSFGTRTAAAKTAYLDDFMLTRNE